MRKIYIFLITKFIFPGSLFFLALFLCNIKKTYAEGSATLRTLYKLINGQWTQKSSNDSVSYNAIYRLIQLPSESSNYQSMMYNSGQLLFTNAIQMEACETENLTLGTFYTDLKNVLFSTPEFASNPNQFDLSFLPTPIHFISFSNIQKNILDKVKKCKERIHDTFGNKSLQLDSFFKNEQGKSVIFRTFVCLKYIFLYIYCANPYPTDR